MDGLYEMRIGKLSRAEIGNPNDMLLVSYEFLRLK